MRKHPLGLCDPLDGQWHYCKECRTHWCDADGGCDCEDEEEEEDCEDESEA